MPFSRILLLISFSVIFSACGITKRGTATEFRKSAPTAALSTSVDVSNANAIEDGIASWYGPDFHGKLTANGEVYDMDGLTAAHRTLPFGTVLLVENLNNGLTVNVRINDRGPFAKNRIIDLSREAAKRVDMIGPGTAPVRLYLLKGDLANSRVTDLKVANFTVQLGSYKTKQQALNLSGQIKGSRVEEILVNGEMYYRVYFGIYQDTEIAAEHLHNLQKQGFTGFVKQLENNAYQ